MNTIGENIRRFRRERDITQEMLADRLHISAQAVSKWERGECLPDVTLIVPIASYLGVSADDLLGVNEAILRERLMEFEKFRLDSVQKLVKNGGSPAAYEENRRELREAVQKLYEDFPDNEDVLYNYLNCYHQTYRIMDMTQEEQAEVLKNAEEIENICNFIIKHGSGEGNRRFAWLSLAYLRKLQGNLAEAVNIVGREIDIGSQQHIITELLRDTPAGKVRAKNQLGNALVELLSDIIRLPEMENLSLTDALDRYGRLIRIVHEMVDNGDEGYTIQSMLSNFHQKIADAALTEGEYELAVTHYGDSIRYLRYSVEEPNHTSSTGFLAGYSRNMLPWMHENWFRDQLIARVNHYKEAPEFAVLREREDFLTLIREYEEYLAE